jgi:ubiquinone/menaquinone biosynthesis C-methylase UbiE
MHSFAPHGDKTTNTSPARATKGLILKGGWRYDLHGWLLDTFTFRGQGRQLRRKAVALAGLLPGEQVLDVGCGTGTLALEIQRRVGSTGRVVGIDPSAEQIARAHAKAARRRVPVEFQIGAIERLAYPDQTFDVVLSTLMMHHLPAGLKRQGLAEIARVLKPEGRLVLADFMRKQERRGRAARFHARGSSLQELAALVRNAGFEQVETEEVRPARFSAFPGAGLLTARKLAGPEPAKQCKSAEGTSKGDTYGAVG